MNPVAISGGSVLGDAASGWLPSEPMPAEAPPFAERYERRALIGQGGMGHVVLAYDHILEREVALKTPRPDHPQGAAVAERLAAEARITAGLEHPGIVAVHDGGRGPDGLPFYVMRLVRGRDLAELIGAAPELGARLQLLRSVLSACEAVAHAHARGVVHRDLKPANVRIGELGSVQVIDWGLAVHAGSAPAEIAGTPPFMSPEQARAEPATAASDVFSLGVVLVALLIGATPTDPGAALAALSERPGREVPKELLAIIGRCLSEPCGSRYSDAAALANDLGAYIDGRRVAAYDYPIGLLLRRLARRWRVQIIAIALMLLTLAVLIEDRHTAVVAERDRANRHLAAALIASAEAHFGEGRLDEARIIAARALQHAEDLPRARGILMARQPSLHRLGTLPLPPRCPSARLSPDGDLLLCLGDGLTHLHAVTGTDLVAKWSVESSATQGQILPEIGRVLVAYPDDRHARLALDSGAPSGPPGDWSASRFAQTRRVPIGINVAGVVTADELGAARMFQPCGRRHAVFAVAPDEVGWAAVCEDGRVLRGRLDRSDMAVIGEVEDAPRFSALAVRGDAVAFGTTRGELGVLEPRTDGGPPPGPSWLRDVSRHVLDLRLHGALIVARLEGGEVRLVSTGGVELGGLPRGVATRGLELTPGGEIIAVGEGLTRWALPDAPAPHRLGLGAGIAGIAVDREGAIAASLGDGRLGVIDTLGAPLATLRAHSDVPRRPIFSNATGNLLAAWSTRPGLYRFDKRGQRLAELSGKAIQDLVILEGEEGEEVVAITWTPSILRYRNDIALPPLDFGMVHRDIDTSPDRRHVVIAAADVPRVILLDADLAGSSPRVLEVSGLVSAAAIGPGGVDVFLAVPGRISRLVAVTGVESTLTETAARVLDLAISPDGRLLAAAGDDGITRVIETGTGTTHAMLPGHRQRVSSAVFGVDGKRLYTSSWDGDVRIWDLAPVTRVEVLEHTLGMTAAEILGDRDTSLD